MAAAPLERDEYIEQAYFFRVFRERLAEGLPSQSVLGQIHEELLTTTRMPAAAQFLAAEMKFGGELAPGFDRLRHYFTPFQGYAVRQAEAQDQRFTMPVALLLLEREATYRAGTPSPAGMFVYQFEAICRNRLGYDGGLAAMAGDPLYDQAWRDYLEWVRRQVGLVDFADLVYLRSEAFVAERRRDEPDYEPPVPALFGAKEGKIAKASRNRDPLYLFSAMQRQLGYPEVPRPRPRDDLAAKLEVLQAKVRDLENKLRVVESEVKGTFDPTQYGKPDAAKFTDDK